MFYAKKKSYPTLQPFRCNSLLKCVTAGNRKKIHRKPLFWGFKVIDINKKLVTIAWLW